MTPTAFVILVLLFLTGVAIYVELARLPGKTARERGHPQADAISVLSWIGLLLGIVPWVIALVWAYTRPIGGLAAATTFAGQTGAATRKATAESPDAPSPEGGSD